MRKIFVKMAENFVKVLSSTMCFFNVYPMVECYAKRNLFDSV